ncbi:glycosyltransferase family 4 protein [Exiguobacterium profundum]|uniref:glycosyltransferase family 4 protein n=1 Tax=Exiguobacterium profundum TaxID=307643 RepID=UPI00391A91F6
MDDSRFRETDRVSVMTRQRLVFLSNIASPYQVKFADVLQEHVDTEFWFYKQITDQRPDWWIIPLGQRCRVLRGSYFSKKTNYLSLDVFLQLIRFRPHILLLAGFTPFHALLLQIVKLFGVRVVVMSEPIRNVRGETSGESTLLTRENGLHKTTRIHRLFKRADLIFGMGNVARDQFINELGFPSERVVSAPYPIDIETHMSHPLRQIEPNDPIHLLFANRLIERYQPLVALEAYRILKEEYPNLSMSLNRDGHLADACRRYIEDEQLTDVTFLDEIESWDGLNLVYRSSDILVLPATYSNGNISIIEACASGMGIVVSYDVNNVARHLHEGINCYKCEPTVASLVTELKHYLDHPERLTTHGQRSKELVTPRLNANTAAVYVDLLQPLYRKGDSHHAEAAVARGSDASSSHHPKSETTRDIHRSL